MGAVPISIGCSHTCSFIPEDREFISGIDALDKRRCRTRPRRSPADAGATGAGKSWGLIHIANRRPAPTWPQASCSARHSWKCPGAGNPALRAVAVLGPPAPHEQNPESRRSNVTAWVRSSSLGDESMHPAFTLDSPFVEMEAQTGLQPTTTFTENLIVKQFPSGSLTVQQLDAYMDELRLTKQFVPDIVVDDPYRVDESQHRRAATFARTQHGRDFRAIGQRRNCAIVTAQRISAKGAERANLIGAHIAEDWSLTNTADVVLVYSATDAEHQFGLGAFSWRRPEGEADELADLAHAGNYSIGQLLPLNSIRSPAGL